MSLLAKPPIKLIVKSLFFNDNQIFSLLYFSVFHLVHRINTGSLSLFFIDNTQKILKYLSLWTSSQVILFLFLMTKKNFRKYFLSERKSTAKVEFKI